MSTYLTIHERDMMPILKQLSLQAYDDFVDYGAGEVISRRGSAETRRIDYRDGGSSNSLFLKVYRHHHPSWRTTLMRDKCSIEAGNYSTLRMLGGVSVPRVVASGRRRDWGRLRDAFILTRGVPAAKGLDQWLDESKERLAVRECVLVDFAALIARMHQAGFYHVDLQLRNVLVSEVDAERPVLYLIDSARGGLRSWSVRRQYGRFRDLSSLHKGAIGRLNGREQLRWLRRYFGVARLGDLHRGMARTILMDRRMKDHGPA